MSIDWLDFKSMSPHYSMPHDKTILIEWCRYY
uniref:Uncharacterized protein n=1 Tax=Arundo donax TaxID=35708 RepID=A0A0A9ED71_ARUDO